MKAAVYDKRIYFDFNTSIICTGFQELHKGVTCPENPAE